MTKANTAYPRPINWIEREALALLPEALRHAAHVVRGDAHGAGLWAIEEPKNGKVFICNSEYPIGRICTVLSEDMVKIGNVGDFTGM